MPHAPAGDTAKGSAPGTYSAIAEMPAHAATPSNSGGCQGEEPLAGDAEAQLKYEIAPVCDNLNSQLSTPRGAADPLQTCGPRGDRSR